VRVTGRKEGEEMGKGRDNLAQRSFLKVVAYGPTLSPASKPVLDLPNTEGWKAELT